MSAELITAALLNVSGVTSLVGTRRAVSQLPQGTTMPALVYEAIDTMPVMMVNASFGAQLLMSRVQVTALADNAAGVDSVLSAVMSAMNLKSGTVAGKSVVSVVRDMRTGIQKDNDAGIWYASQDFIFHWYE
jgi:branched-subunit amino acid transport protein